jgi:arabinogalactan endo-1,4-beta-galactosidase
VIPGTTSSGLAVTAEVAVVGADFVVDGSFEDGDPAWTLGGVAQRSETADASAGNFAITFWEGSAYTASVAQTLTGVPAGSYELRATTQGTNVAAGDARTLSATTSQGTASGQLQFNGWRVYTTTSVPVTVGEDGLVDISADFALSAGAWGVLDDVELVPAVAGGERADTTALVALLDEAEAVDRTMWTADSLAALDEALAIGRVVIAGSLATQADADAASAQLRAAIDALSPATKAPGKKKHK